MKAKVYISRDNTNLKDEILKSFHWVGGSIRQTKSG